MLHITETYYMKDELLSEKDAAAFCQLALGYFKNLRRTSRGPAFVRPSPHKTFYKRSALEAWRSSWLTVVPTKENE